jgi:hypothetical protein
MTASSDAGDAQEVSTFSECVIGYRSWEVGADESLLPLSPGHRPWKPGINTARCDCRAPNSLRFEATWEAGRRVIVPAPQHPAPQQDCDCGLYSWRRPARRWAHDPDYGRGRRVCGAVASWGHLQVHDDGFRAEHACVVTLAYPEGADPDALELLEGIACRYRVELVQLGVLEQVASRHGTRLPDTLRPPTARQVELIEDPQRVTNLLPLAAWKQAPDLTVDDFEGLNDQPRLKRSQVGLMIALVLMLLIVAVIVFAHRSTPCHLQITRIPGTAADTEQCASSPSTP